MIFEPELDLDLEPNLFVKFWEEFPRHTDRARAEANFARECKVNSPGAIIGAAIQYSRQLPSPDLAMSAASWLSSGEWRRYPLGQAF